MLDTEKINFRTDTSLHKTLIDDQLIVLGLQDSTDTKPFPWEFFFVIVEDTYEDDGDIPKEFDYPEG